MSATWSKTASDKSWHESDYRLCVDGDRHEEIHTISHYKCFILCYCYVSVLPLLDSRSNLIPQKRSSRFSRQCLHHHKSDIFGSGLIKLRCYQFFPTRWVRVGLLLHKHLVS